MNYWYVARPNELFIDMDKPQRSLAHAKARLQGAIEYKRLDVLAVQVYPSTSEDHIHVRILLKKSLPEIQRMVWEIILHGDIYRSCCNLMRYDFAVKSHSLIIGKTLWTSRAPDASCNCMGKHTKNIMLKCPAAIKLRGKDRARGFFGKPSKNPCTIWPED